MSRKPRRQACELFLVSWNQYTLEIPDHWQHVLPFSTSNCLIINFLKAREHTNIILWHQNYIQTNTNSTVFSYLCKIYRLIFQGALNSFSHFSAELQEEGRNKSMHGVGPLLCCAGCLQLLRGIFPWWMEVLSADGSLG